MTPVLRGGRAGVLAEGVELQLCLIAHLGGQRLVPRNVEIGTTGDLIGLDPIAGLDVSKDASFDVWHGGGGGEQECEMSASSVDGRGPRRKSGAFWLVADRHRVRLTRTLHRRPTITCREGRDMVELAIVSRFFFAALTYAHAIV